MEIKRIFDTDHHWMPAPDTFTSRLAKKYQHVAPQVVPDEKYGEVWSFEGGATLRAFGLECVGGAEPKDYTWKCTYQTMDPAFWQAKPRVKAMDADGVDVALQFPSVSSYHTIRDDDLYLQVIRVYNDAIWDWAQEGDPKRIIPAALYPVGLGNEVAIEEIQRAAKKGYIHVAWCGLPRNRMAQPQTVAFGLGPGVVPSHEDDPFFAAVQEAGLVVSNHGAQPRGAKLSPGETVKKAERSAGSVPPPRQGIGGRGSGLGTANNLGELIMGGVFERFPGLKMSYIETSAAWLPSFLEQLDQAYLQHRELAEFPISKLPSEYAKNIRIPVDIELQAIKYRHLVGVERLTVGTDYPHFGTRFPHTRWYFDLIFSGVPQDEADKILWGNAAAHYGIN